MNLKKIGAILLALLALGAVVANSAMATATESKGFWYVGGTKLAEGTKVPISCALASEKVTLTGTIGGVALKIQSNSLNCSEAAIFNQASFPTTGKTINAPSPSLVEPANCKLANGEFHTEPLIGQVFMEGTKALSRAIPVKGTTFAKVEITECALAGTYELKGSLFAELTNATNVASTSQKMKFSKAINAAAGGELTIGGKPAAIEGEATAKLTSGQEWKVNET